MAIWLTTVSMLAHRASDRRRWVRPSFPKRWLATPSGLMLRVGELCADPRPGHRHHGHGAGRRLDDLDWQLRLGVQLVCAIRARRVGRAGHAVRAVHSPARSGGAVTVLWIVGLTNAFNMLDNMDGLAASVGLIAAVLFCGAQLAVGSLFVPAVLLVLVGALAGFLVHNHAPARLFMGDAGSNFLGFLLGA